MKWSIKIASTRNFFLLLIFSLFFINVSVAQEMRANGKTLIVYFSQPETIDSTDVDGFSGASVVMKNGKTSGSTEYIAQIIQKQTHGDLFRIETVKPYPLIHEPLIRYAEQEQRDNIHPELKNKLNNINDYDVVFIGYPIWWYKMPMALYTFFDQYDLSSKTIIPFTTHGGSHFSGSIQEIKRLEPKANVIDDGLDISRNDVADNDTEEKIIKWLNNLK